jgi:hypothetical protein
MNKLKTMLSALVVLLMFSTAAMAQDAANTNAKTITEQLKTQLALNDSQTAKVLEVNRTYFKKLNDAKLAGGSKVDQAKKFKTLDTDREAKMKSVISADQYKIYVANRGVNNKKLSELTKE